MRNNQPILEYAILIIVIAASIAFFLSVKNQEINFCRDVFNYLVKGSPAAEKFIDWEKLKALNVDVGATYNALPNEKEKADYKKEFIRNFAFAFQKNGGKLSLFTHWRIYDKNNAGVVVVACDHLGYNKTLLFTISKLRRSKLISLEWESAQ